MMKMGTNNLNKSTKSNRNIMSTSSSSSISSSNSSTYGLSAPISTLEPKEIDYELTKRLEDTLRTTFDLFESDDEMTHRMSVMAALNELVKKWVKEVSILKKIPPEVASEINAKVFTFGSFRLGVHTKGADIDTLLVAPRHVDRKDFFTSFVKMLSSMRSVEYVHPVEDAFVPVIKTKIENIELDILFARLALANIPDDQDLKNVELLRNLEESCVRSINGCRVTNDILQLVPNHESFKLALRAIKLWAKRKGVYSNALGYLGGVSWAMLVARTSQLYPKALAATLVHKFFRVFSKWPWPRPVLLRNLSDDFGNLGYPVWDPRTNHLDSYHLMPIITPSYPQQNSTFNVTVSTLTLMKTQFELANEVCENIYKGQADWKDFFEPINFFILYRHFLALIASSQPEWIGLIESKIRFLVQALERHSCIKLAHINPTGYKKVIENTEENKNKEKSNETQTIWFIGLEFDKTVAVNIDLTDTITIFTNQVQNTAKTAKKFTEQMKLDSKHVKRKELTKYLPPETLNIKKSSKSKKTQAKAILSTNIPNNDNLRPESALSNYSLISASTEDSSSVNVNIGDLNDVNNKDFRDSINSNELLNDSNEVQVLEVNKNNVKTNKRKSDCLETSESENNLNSGKRDNSDEVDQREKKLNKSVNDVQAVEVNDNKVISDRLDSTVVNENNLNSGKRKRNNSDEVDQQEKKLNKSVNDVQTVEVNDNKVISDRLDSTVINVNDLNGRKRKRSNSDEVEQREKKLNESVNENELNNSYEHNRDNSTEVLEPENSFETCSEKKPDSTLELDRCINSRKRKSDHLDDLYENERVTESIISFDGNVDQIEEDLVNKKRIVEIIKDENDGVDKINESKKKLVDNGNDRVVNSTEEKS